MEDTNKLEYLDTDDQGRIITTPDIADRYGIKKGSHLRVIETQRGLEILVPSRLRKLYIEPTNMCNLDCRTCLRNSWNEPLGQMSPDVFAKIVEGLRTFDPIPSVTFGGQGEPLLHPDIIDMVSQVKALGVEVQLITNGTLLTKEMSQQLCKTKLDMLWVSLDGSKPESYADIRLGAELPKVLENIRYFSETMYATTTLKSECEGYQESRLGIAFVAMKRNIHDLPDIIKIGQKYGAEKFLISNVLPYTRDMIDDVLYYGVLNSTNPHRLSMTALDANELTYVPVYQALHQLYGNTSGNNVGLIKNHCPFIENGVGAIGWDGSLSPCLPLTHDFTSYHGNIRFDEHHSRRWTIGNLKEKSLHDLWYDTSHLAFRERVQSFDYAPCTYCGSCERFENNEEDCFGNTFPACGGCLWAQGVIQCP